MSEDEKKLYPISREEALKTHPCFGTYEIDCYLRKKEGRPCKFSEECFRYTRKFNPESLKLNREQ